MDSCIIVREGMMMINANINFPNSPSSSYPFSIDYEHVIVITTEDTHKYYTFIV